MVAGQISVAFLFDSVVASVSVVTGPDAAFAIALTTIIYPGLLSRPNQKLFVTCSNYMKEARLFTLRDPAYLRKESGEFNRYINTSYHS